MWINPKVEAQHCISCTAHAVASFPLRYSSHYHKLSYTTEIFNVTVSTTPYLTLWINTVKSTPPITIHTHSLCGGGGFSVQKRNLGTDT